MSEFQLEILRVGATTVVATGLLLWSVTTVRYRITSKYLLVLWLGLPVRWISLTQIKRVGNKPVLWAERWPNVFFERGRVLVIRRHRGLFRNFLITPKYPFEFKTSLEQARAAALGLTPGRPTGAGSASEPSPADGPNPKPFRPTGTPERKTQDAA